MSTAQIYPHTDNHFFQLGIDYYITARFGALAGLAPVTGNLFHHAIEMLLKGKLAQTHTLEQLNHTFRHFLVKAWGAFKALFASEDLASFDAVVEALDRFHKIRYPDDYLVNGAAITIGFGPACTRMGPDNVSRTPRYHVNVNDLDKLVARIFQLSCKNLRAFFLGKNEEARRVANMMNEVFKM